MPDPDPEIKERAGLQKKKTFSALRASAWSKNKGGGAGPSPGSATDNLQLDILFWGDSRKVASKMKREEGPPDCRLMMIMLFTDHLQSRQGLATWPLSSVTVSCWMLFKSYFHYRDHYQLASFCYKMEPRLIRRTNVEEVLCIMLLYWGKQGKQLICIIN